MRKKEALMLTRRHTTTEHRRERVGSERKLAYGADTGRFLFRLLHASICMSCRKKIGTSASLRCGTRRVILVYTMRVRQKYIDVISCRLLVVTRYIRVYVQKEMVEWHLSCILRSRAS